MDLPLWIWDTAIGIAGISIMFGLVMLGTKKKGILSHALTFLGVGLGAIILAYALDRSILDRFF